MAKAPDEFPYGIADLLEERNNALFQEVNGAAPVQLVLSKEDRWTGVLNADGVSSTIGVLACANPRPPFTHEPLHIKL